MKFSVDIIWKTCIIINCAWQKGKEKQNIRKIYGECFKRKTLTSGIENDIIIFAGDKPDKRWKKLFKIKWKSAWQQTEDLIK